MMEEKGFNPIYIENKCLINNYFGGDGLEYARCYYEHLAKLPQYCKQLDIVGHFDLLEKHEEKTFCLITIHKNTKITL